MRTLISGIALLALAGCATSQPAGTWVSDGRGGYCYRQGAACSYTGATPKVEDNRALKFTGDFLEAVNNANRDLGGRGVYTGR